MTEFARQDPTSLTWSIDYARRPAARRPKEKAQAAVLENFKASLKWAGLRIDRRYGPEKLLGKLEASRSVIE